MKKNKRNSGFTLIETMMAVGLIAVIMVSLLTVMNVMSKRNGETTNSSWAYDLRLEVTNAINSKKAFDENTMNANSNLSCIRNDTDCTGQGGPILLMDAGGVPLRLVAAPGNTTQGITRRGDVCNTFGTSPDCPYRYEVSWTPICATGNGPGCKDPQVQINSRMLLSPVASAGSFRVDNFSLRVNRIEKGTIDMAKICGALGGGMSGARCNLPIGNPCADPAKPYLIGYTAAGTPRCGSEVAKRCPIGGVLNSLNADGTYTCVDGCGSVGAGGGTLEFIE